jgi:hypothetical protein
MLSVSEACYKCFRCVVQNVSYVPNVCCKRSDLNVAYVYVSHIFCSKCFHVASCKCFYLMLHMFHIYVTIVCSKCFIRYIRMLHSSVSCCTCFMLFEEPRSAGIYGDTARTLGNNGVRQARGRQTGHAVRWGCRSEAQWERGAVQDGANGLEFRRTGRAVRARRIMCGRCDRIGAAGQEQNQRMDRLRGYPDASSRQTSGHWSLLKLKGLAIGW